MDRAHAVTLAKSLRERASEGMAFDQDLDDAADIIEAVVDLLDHAGWPENAADLIGRLTAR